MHYSTTMNGIIILRIYLNVHPSDFLHRRMVGMERICPLLLSTACSCKADVSSSNRTCASTVSKMPLVNLLFLPLPVRRIMDPVY